MAFQCSEPLAVLEYVLYRASVSVSWVLGLIVKGDLD